jgi:hypothetical protein
VPPIFGYLEGPPDDERVFDGALVGPGASAGGRDALGPFFTALPPCDDAAFVALRARRD